MTAHTPTVGLVLVGGGAKGAYQAGALRYLAELDFSPHIIAGTSIGALNGAVLAANKPLKQAVQRLDELWDQLGQAHILRPNTTATMRVMSYAARAFLPNLRHWATDFFIEQGLLGDRLAIFDPEPIEQFLRQAVDPQALRQGTELWATVFPSLQIPGLNYDCLIDLARAFMGTKAHWLRVQDCDDDETLYNLLLASAAIPLAFPCRTVNGQRYVDGALSDNVPLGALAARGCTHAIVIHLGNGSTWNRHDFPEQTVIEIRPEAPINAFNTPLLGSVSATLDFSFERITELKQRGYEDAKRCMEPIIQTFQTVNGQRETHDRLVCSTHQLFNDSPL